MYMKELKECSYSVLFNSDVIVPIIVLQFISHYFIYINLTHRWVKYNQELIIRIYRFKLISPLGYIYLY